MAFARLQIDLDRMGLPEGGDTLYEAGGRIDGAGGSDGDEQVAGIESHLKAKLSRGSRLSV